jgi:hypothetical protein
LAFFWPGTKFEARRLEGVADEEVSESRLRDSKYSAYRLASAESSESEKEWIQKARGPWTNLHALEGRR